MNSVALSPLQAFPVAVNQSLIVIYTHVLSIAFLAQVKI